MASLLSTFTNPQCSPSFSGELAFSRKSHSLTKHSRNRNLFFWPNRGKPRRSHQCFSMSSMQKDPVEDDESDIEETLIFDETLEAPGEYPRPLNEIWQEVQGTNDWEGLLDPMNSHLRREIIRYGELAQACYDSFDFDPHSKYCGTCKYPGAEFFDKLETGYSGYKMARYLYATSNINLPNIFQHSRFSKVWSKYAN